MASVTGGTVRECCTCLGAGEIFRHHVGTECWYCKGTGIEPPRICRTCADWRQGFNEYEGECQSWAALSSGDITDACYTCRSYRSPEPDSAGAEEDEI